MMKLWKLHILSGQNATNFQISLQTASHAIRTGSSFANRIGGPFERGHANLPTVLKAVAYYQSIGCFRDAIFRGYMSATGSIPERQLFLGTLAEPPRRFQGRTLPYL